MNYAIIAAGEGSRLVQEGVRYPKPLVRLNGVPMIKRLIDIMMDCNPESLSVIVNEQMTEVADYLRTLRLPVSLNLTVKSTPSSMHSFYEVSRNMPETGRFCLTTVDTIFHADDFRRYVEAFESDKEGLDGYMGVTTFVDDEKPLYISTGSDRLITAFTDTKRDDTTCISGGIYGLTAPAVRVLEQCLDKGVSRMRNYQRALIEANLKLRAWTFSKIIDVDHAGDIATAENFIADERH